MLSASLVVPRGRGRLIRYLLGCVAGLLFLQCFLSLLAARRALPTSFFQFDSSASLSPRVALGLTNSTARPATGAGGGPRDPLLLKVMVDPGSKAPVPAAAASANVTAAGNVTSVPVNGTTSSQAPPPPPTTAVPRAPEPADGRQRCPPVPLKLGK